MTEEGTRTCANCKLKIAPQNYMMHTLHCVRHLQLCTSCGDPYPKDEIDDHIIAEHGTEKCEACGEDVEKGFMQNHMQTDCFKRLIACPYCELELPSCDMTKHTDYCGTRTEKCEDCEEFVLLKYKELHLESNHTFLKLDDEPGPRPSWKQTMATASSTGNSETMTLLPCEFCNGMFTPQELNRHAVSCMRGWQTTVPILRRISTVRCSSCGKSIAAKEYQAHQIGCVLLDSPAQLDCDGTDTIPCELCNEGIPFEGYMEHYNDCAKYAFTTVWNNKVPRNRGRKNSIIPCDVCNRPITFEKYQEHCNLCTLPKSSRDTRPNHYVGNNSESKLPCEFCDESFAPDNLAVHQIYCASKT
ncbi:uncharacterized protein LOC105682952 [Athalia rosae]|uniref:uncharacterized protein LOC105682952 n=1 Tax=Athalia rosae TaxID=37344 RepID=UPI0020343BD0|nr:uncharacterized protein LOC105682952 [Athalia rosae]